ncbi:MULTISPECIES: hypothetical protein [unclassified Microcoleus]|uniref:hypothetical protein n=1 Tax=unclassified Microcoleus TaxID=2642155 RepID=UPI002FD103DF
MFFKKQQKSQPAANLRQQQSTITSTKESTLSCVELSDEELLAVAGGLINARLKVGVDVVDARV